MTGGSEATVRRIGRHDEYGLLTRAVDLAISGAGTTVLIEGEAGIGKTRLTLDALVHARRHGCVVAEGTQDPIGVHRPFGVLLDALGELGDNRFPTPKASDGDGLELLISEACVETVQRACAETPMVVAIENLHWADPETIRTLSRLVRMASQHALSLVLTTRPVPLDRSVDQLAGIVADSGGDHRALEPLGAAEVEELATAILGVRPGPGLSQRLESVGGNPLYAQELLQGLSELGGLQIADDVAELTAETASPAVTLTMLRRLSVLSSSSLAVIRYASILGSTFSLDDLRAVSSRPLDELTGAVEEALTAGLLTVTAEGLMFRHDLIWELLYEDIGAAIRAVLHSEAAAALTDAGRPPEDVADHLLRGLVGTDSATLALLADTARALRHRSPGLVLTLTDRAVEVADPDHSLMPTIRAERALALLATGNHEEGRRACREALDTGIRLSLRTRVQEALEGSLILGGRIDEAIELCERMLESTTDPDRRLHVLAALAFSKLYSGQAESAIELTEEAVRAAQHAEPEAVAKVQTARGHALSHLGRFRESVEVSVRAAAEMDRYGYDVVHYAHPIAGNGMITLDRFDDALEMLERGRRLYERHGSVGGLCQYHVSKGFGHFLAGEWDDAVGELEATGDLLDEGLAWPVLSNGTLALIAVHRGQDRTARRHVATAMSALEAGASALRIDLVLQARQILLESSAGGLGQDESVDHQVAAMAREEWQSLTAGSSTVSALGFAPQIAHRLAQLGDADGARAVSTVLLGCAEQNGRAPGILGAALLSRGIADHDTDALRRAVDTYRKSSHVVARAFASRIAGEALLSEGQHDEGTELLRDARLLCDTLRATTEAHYINQALRIRGLPTMGDPPRRAVSGWDALTPTEHKVAEYLGQRLSNPEIADEMHISRRTVESHVSKILAKLGVGSRIEVARQITGR